MNLVLSFDVEEHHRIEAAAGLECPADLRGRYADRMDATTRWLLDRLAERGLRATFFVVGEIARDRPALVRAIADAGHEVASHSWDHRRVHRLTPETFREDLRKSRDALEQAAGTAVVGYRAPTFSVVRQTAWAVDVLAEEGFRYDSSVFPVRHDRYGVPDAPRMPFHIEGERAGLLEMPPATLRCLGVNVPVGGGGYFRLLPLWVIERAAWQLTAAGSPAVVLYFHPWEFDPDQPRLPLGRVSAWRTYVGTGTSRAKLGRLLDRHTFTRCVDVADALATEPLARFALA